VGHVVAVDHRGLGAFEHQARDLGGVLRRDAEGERLEVARRRTGSGRQGAQVLLPVAVRRVRIGAGSAADR
jgi:hypothetical protein